MVGPFKIEDAIDVMEVSEDKVIDTYEVLSKVMPVLIVKGKMAFHAAHGVIFKGDIHPSHGTILMVDENHNVLSIYKYEDGKYICQRGINEYGDHSI